MNTTQTFYQGVVRSAWFSFTEGYIYRPWIWSYNPVSAGTLLTRVEFNPLIVCEPGEPASIVYTLEV